MKRAESKLQWLLLGIDRTKKDAKMAKDRQGLEGSIDRRRASERGSARRKGAQPKKGIKREERGKKARRVLPPEPRGIQS
ncbi:unnamed protein product [Xylocopa violacea]|uniref:Uncharacterized protein n=1 Tax=Xylocopa violacea TaxID=135666 RepID=A0ABP1N2G5_XYLVO